MAKKEKASDTLTVKNIDGVWRIMGYLTHAEYAEKHGLREGSVRRWIYHGKIRAVRIGNGWWIKEDTPLPPNISKMKFEEKIKWMEKHGDELTDKFYSANRGKVPNKNTNKN